MAVGNAIVQTAKFKPLSFQEWAAPLQALNAAHEKQEEDLNTLMDDANKYERYIRQNPSSEVARQYNDYISQIEAEAQALSQNGITPDRRTALLELRRNYNNQIKPVKAAVETLSDIEKQYLKDSRKGIIGAPDIDINFLLEHPDYTVADYKKSYTLGEDVIKYSNDLFKGLTGYDNTPRTVASEDGNYAYIVTPQGYTTQDLYTALTGEGEGVVTPELSNAVNTVRQYFNYDKLDDISKSQIDQLIFSTASRHTKEDKVTVRNAPKGHKISASGQVVSKHKGYTPVTIDSGSVIYKKGSQYYKEDLEGNPTIPVSKATIGEVEYVQKEGAPAGTLVEPTKKSTTNKTTGTTSTAAQTTEKTPNHKVIKKVDKKQSSTQQVAQKGKTEKQTSSNRGL